MGTVLNLHKTQPEADWYYVKHSDRNGWQKLAASTGGVVAPANATTVAGAALVLIGLVMILNEVTITAVTLIAVGRLADIADGYIADKTGTKSPLGEVFDTVTDKLLGLVALVLLLATGLIPILILAVIAAQFAANSIISGYGRLKGTIIHPTLSGKLATAVSWSVLIFYLLYNLLANIITANLFLIFAWLAFAAFIVLGAYSTFSYFRQLQKDLA